MAAALLIKVGALLLKTMAKPLSTRFEKWVMSHPVARQRIVHAAQVRAPGCRCRQWAHGGRCLGPLLTNRRPGSRDAPKRWQLQVANRGQRR